MWQNGNMYGGFYDRRFGYNPNAVGSTMIMPQTNAGYGKSYSQPYTGNGYNPLRLQPIQPSATPQPQFHEYTPPTKNSQSRRLSRPGDSGAATPGFEYSDSASSPGSSFADASLPAVNVSSNLQTQTYASQAPKRFASAQPYTLQRNMSMRVGNQQPAGAHGVSASTQSHPQAQQQQQQQQQQQSMPGLGPPLPSVQRRVSFRRTSSTLGGTDLDTAAYRRIDSGFDCRPDASFRGSGALDRQYSNLGGFSDFYKYNPQPEAETTSVSSKYVPNGRHAPLQRDGAGGTSLYRMYSFANADTGSTLTRGGSNYGSMYGGQNLYGGGGGNSRAGTSLYGTMSSNNMQPSYSFAGSAVQGYGSGFALLDSATEENEFGGGSSVADLWNRSASTLPHASKSASVSPTPSITPSIRTSGSSQRPRSQSAPASRPAPPQPVVSSTTVERPGSGRRRRQRPPKRSTAEEEGSTARTSAVVVESPPPALPLPPPPPPPPPQPEEILVPIRRRASAPVNAARPVVTPFEQVRALRRVQTSGYEAPASQPMPLSSTIGRRRGTSGGLQFSGAAVV